MTIHDRYLLYTPKAEAPSPMQGPGVSRRAERQDEMLAWLGLFDDTKVAFSSVVEGRPRTASVGEVPSENWVPFVENRQGSVLAPGTVLKVDQYPGIDSKDLAAGKTPPPRIPGAPNYRRLSAGKTDDSPSVHGVAQPTIEGIRGVLEQAGAAPGGDGKPAVWTNLREEPVVYINGRPLNLRLASNIRGNAENPGVSGQDIERTEEQLKKEILAEAGRNGGRILVHDEGPDGQVIARWETITPESVQTTREVFDTLRQEGYKVDYARIPVTDEKSPELHDFDALTERLKNVDPDAQLIFNCHAGRGRTTTGMVVAGLIQRARKGVEPGTSVKRSPAVKQDIREQGEGKPSLYRTILSLIGALEAGPQSKAEADELIDRFASLQNLRDAIEGYKKKAASAATPQERDAALQRARDYLERYHNIVAFDAYAKDQAPNGFQQPFSSWLDEHPEVRRTQGHLELALGLRPDGMEATAFA